MAGHSRPPKLARRLFPSSDSSSGPPDEDTGPGGGGWRPHNREDSRGSEAGTAESWEFRSVQETPERHDTAAPIARLESLDELETSQVRVMVTHRIGVCLQQLSLLVSNCKLWRGINVL